MSQAVFAARPGGPEVLELRSVDLSPPGPHEVLITVRAAGVNRPDLLQRHGAYPPPPGAPQSLGLEVAGVIEAVGSDVSGLAVGDAVMALLSGGGYATHALCAAGTVLPKPQALSFEEAAAFPETAFTVWTNVFEAGGLRPGERLLVHGATSGIGTMAGKMARAFGAEAYGTAGSAKRARSAEALGYARCFDYRREDWTALTQADGGADVVLDMVGGDYLARNVALLRPGGRHVSIAFLGGTEGTLDIRAVMTKRLTVTGSTLRARPPEEKARLAAEVRRCVLPKLAAGEVTPVIDKVFPLAHAADAHRHLEAGGHVGKVVLTV
ncbi:NAD(P)H-quinone oxidoreductase [Parvularcula dongshanensis]|uniref:Putative PIG3 family NAD(P)H quinone oxidoreductase n=1 Tax=Parvularcula dongshanensis TaxID=1173995 RepID=A0A840I3T2_9PROT|nr:NAD(P)H-quinone oxidoreductase [Parvularcula dongshanensis]MBB4658700.1 putative PIG3 family NAD(P)H quinone oxidoreductase [Parvularcula dongshanensis]